MEEKLRGKGNRGKIKQKEKENFKKQENGKI
jgi:hypothetical protein